ncbi:MAG: DNA recombination protein RmuC, partial [Myxococcota bacterium]
MDLLVVLLAFLVGGALGVAGALAVSRTLRHQERHAADRALAQVEQSEQRLREAFGALSAEALRQSQRSFLDLAKGTFSELQQGASHDLETRHQAIEALVTPLRESLHQVDAKLHVVEKERREHYGQLTEQLRHVASAHERLHSETHNLVKALRAPTVRGRWGEIQLKRVVEMAGMLEHCDFSLQETAADSRLRPDLLVRLPGGKNVVVDAKAPLEAYLGATEVDDESERRRLLGEHARQVRDHMTRLGSKNYQDQFDPSPEFVVMFLPGETFFSAALEHDPALIEFGVDRGVIPASPTTLIALLRAVAYGWQQEGLARSAREISELGRELHGRVGRLAGHFVRLGSGLDRAVQAYNETLGSLESRVLVQARRFRELGAARSGDEIPELKPLDRGVREPRPGEAEVPEQAEPPESDR